MSEPLKRTVNEKGDIIIHPHEALQSIAVELHRGNNISAAIERHLAALVAQAEKGQGGVLAAQDRSLELVEKIFAPIVAMLGNRKSGAMMPEAPTEPALPARNPAVPAPSTTARLMASVHARAVEVE